MRKILIANRKGGVAKSTTATHLAAGLAYAGRRVLLIDGDSQNHCAKLLGVAEGPGLAELLLEECGIDSATVEARPNLFLLQGGRKLSGLSNLIAREDLRPELYISRRLAHLEDRYQVALIDTAPSFGNVGLNLVFYADELICPVSLEVLAADGMVAFLQELDEIRELTDYSIPYRILPTMEDRRTKLTEQLLGQLRAAYHDLVLDPIPTSADVKRLAAFGQTVYEYAPRDRAGRAYAELVGQLAGE